MNRTKIRGAVAAVAGALLMGLGANAMADSNDDLINALMEKGVLTEEEGGQLLKGHTDEKAKKNSEIKASFKDGIGFESGDHANAISVNGRVQADYRNFGKSDAQNTDVIDLRRAYLTVKGKFYNDYDFNVTADFAQGQTGATSGTNQLDVAYFGINWWEQAKFRFGQFDMPFGLEHLTSDLFTDFQERAFTDALVPGKERGVMIHGAPIKGVYYGLAGSTGRGKNVSNQDKQVEGLEVIGRVTANFAEILDKSDAVYHIGADFSHGYISPNQKFGSGVAANNSFAPVSGVTEARGNTFFAPTAFTAAAGDDIERTRYGIEGAVAYGPVKIQSEYFGHNYKGANAAGSKYDKDITAWYASINWLVTGESFASTYKDGVFGRVKPKNDFVHPSASSGIGAIQLGLRYSEFDASDFAFAAGAANAGTGNAALGRSTGAHAWTAGAQWILNPNTRILANYVETKFDDGNVAFTNNQGGASGGGVTDKERAVTLRAQFDF